MPLKLRPTGLGSGIDKNRPDYTIVTGEWEVGGIRSTASSRRATPPCKRSREAGTKRPDCKEQSAR